MKSTEKDHALAVGNLYFHLRPVKWLYEPVEKFEHLGKPLYWQPDCILVHQKKVYVVEVQLSPLGAKRWIRKWGMFNLYFNGGHFREAAFQAWAKNPILPQFMVITSQQPETVKQGFNVENRELIVVRDMR